jgi:hypothetical protein
MMRKNITSVFINPRSNLMKDSFEKAKAGTKSFWAKYGNKVMMAVALAAGAGLQAGVTTYRSRHNG